MGERTTTVSSTDFICSRVGIDAKPHIPIDSSHDDASDEVPLRRGEKRLAPRSPLDAASDIRLAPRSPLDAASDVDQERREEKRHAIIAVVKATTEYKAMKKEHIDNDGCPKTPDPTDRSISKRTW